MLWIGKLSERTLPFKNPVWVVLELTGDIGLLGLFVLISEYQHYWVVSYEAVEDSGVLV